MFPISTKEKEKIDSPIKIGTLPVIIKKEETTWGRKINSSSSDIEDGYEIVLR